jgi:hypothetical protein
MGTITRTFANNITTSGVFKPTAFNNASFDNVTAVPSGAVEGGNMVLLSTQTASASASISFTTGIDSTYKEYMFICNNIHPSNDDTHFQFNFSTDGGSTYNVTKTSTAFASEQQEDGTNDGLFYSGFADLAQSTSYQMLAPGMDNTNNTSCASGYLHLFQPSSDTFVKHYISAFHIAQHSADNQRYSSTYRTAGYGNTSSAVNAINFNISLGNIDAGTIQMFGIL